MHLGRENHLGKRKMWGKAICFILGGEKERRSHSLPLGGEGGVLARGGVKEVRGTFLPLHWGGGGRDLFYLRERTELFFGIICAQGLEEPS